VRHRRGFHRQRTWRRADGRRPAGRL